MPDGKVTVDPRARSASTRAGRSPGRSPTTGGPGRSPPRAALRERSPRQANPDRHEFDTESTPGRASCASSVTPGLGLGWADVDHREAGLRRSLQLTRITVFLGALVILMGAIAATPRR